MDQDIFVKKYMSLLSQKMATYGYDPKKLVDAVWAGTSAMVKNDGTQSNEEVFWNVFSEVYGAKVKDDINLFDEFYRREFAGVKEVCGFNPQAAETVWKLKEKGFRIVLATNPLFPQIATQNRIRWAGLEPEDFEFYTTYENARYCKPNPKYYVDIMQQLNVTPEECLMVGNDVTEDMVAQEIGMKVFLLTDCMINREQKDIFVYPNGSFSSLLDYINAEIC